MKDKSIVIHLIVSHRQCICKERGKKYVGTPIPIIFVFVSSRLPMIRIQTSPLFSTLESLDIVVVLSNRFRSKIYCAIQDTEQSQSPLESPKCLRRTKLFLYTPSIL